MRMKQKTLQYSFSIKHIGYLLPSYSSPLSRYPSAEPDEEDRKFSDDLEITSLVIATITTNDISITLSKLSEYTENEEEYQYLLEKIRNDGFAKFQKDKSPVGKQFFHIKDCLSIVDNFIVYSYGGESRFLIPKDLRPSILDSLHSAHQGVDSTLRRARQCVYWPGLTNSINQIFSSCKLCVENAPSLTKEPLLTSPIPVYPFQMAVADLFHKDGYKYLAYANCLAAWIINVFRDLFQRHGVPEELSLDGGPNISSSEVVHFLRSWGTALRTSSAYYPKSNGHAELAVKTSK